MDALTKKYTLLKRGISLLELYGQRFGQQAHPNTRKEE